MISALWELIFKGVEENIKTSEELHKKFIMPMIYKNILYIRLLENRYMSLATILKNHAVIKSIDNNSIEIILYNPKPFITEILYKASNKIALKAELFNIFKKDLEIKYNYKFCKIDKIERELEK